MQHPFHRLSDQQLLDIFILIEDQHEQLAIEYLICHAHLSRTDAMTTVQYFVHERDQALKRYVHEDQLLLPLRKLEREHIVIAAEDDFPDDFIENLDWYIPRRVNRQDSAKTASFSKSSQLYILYGLFTLLTLSISSLLYHASA